MRRDEVGSTGRLVVATGEIAGSVALPCTGSPPLSSAADFASLTPKAMADTTLMDKLVSLCKRRGFVFQSSEIYGGLGSVWDYGPLGVELKKNVKDRWWRSMVHARDDI